MRMPTPFSNVIPTTRRCEVLVMELSGAPGYFRLVAHSVNRAPNGTFVDVTPLSKAERKTYRFVEHHGPEDQFNELKVKFAELYFPIMDALASSESGVR
jgi:hypothetical protein